MSGKSKWHYSRVLLADDGSEHAQAAVKLLCDLPLAKDTELTVLRAFHSTQATEVYALEASLKETCGILQAAGFTPKPELILGSPAEKIIDFVLEHRPQLILLGAKGLRATFGILLGGVAQQVVEYACCPVLIVRAPYQGLRRILVVTDGSSYSEEAVNYLAKFPMPKGVEITAMHVLAPPLPPFFPIEPGYVGPPVPQPIPVPEETIKQRSNEEKVAKAFLTKAEKQLAGSGRKVNKILRRGDAATEIIEYVKTAGVDLIVTGSRGLSQMKAWLLGSVSRKLVHYSDSSILVVRRPES
jgi:nucleotide-binding universal stress UspA family protein